MTGKIQHYDLCIVGGGINGAGIARDAAGQGLTVILLEQGDLAGATSSASTKLIHGGLRYLENFDFKLVGESLHERDVLARIAPHIVRPMRFRLPLARGVRPAWIISAGLFLYDRMAGSDIFPDARKITLGAPLKPVYKTGFAYSDAWVEDSRLVVLNALDARERGATILTRHPVQKIHAENGQWTITAKELWSGQPHTVTSQMIVNTGGPWVRRILDDNGLSTPETPRIRLVQGSHIIVPALFDGPDAYLLQQPDKRVVFAIPYEEKYTLIGTTETDVTSPENPVITPGEIKYLCESANRFFEKQITAEDIVSTYAGIRPLFDDGQSSARTVTRDYRFHTQDHNGAPITSVFGGKLTTYRHLSEEAVKIICEKFAKPYRRFTHSVPLPGGQIENMAAFTAEQQRNHPSVSPDLIARYARAYGTRLDRIAHHPGMWIGDDLFEGEIRYLIDQEWARRPEDVLWRRGKRGLYISETTNRRLHAMMPAWVREMTGYDTTAFAVD